MIIIINLLEISFVVTEVCLHSNSIVAFADLHTTNINSGCLIILSYSCTRRCVFASGYPMNCPTEVQVGLWVLSQHNVGEFATWFQVFIWYCESWLECSHIMTAFTNPFVHMFWVYWVSGAETIPNVVKNVCVLCTVSGLTACYMQPNASKAITNEQVCEEVLVQQNTTI